MVLVKCAQTKLCLTPKTDIVFHWSAPHLLQHHGTTNALDPEKCTIKSKINAFTAQLTPELKITTPSVDQTLAQLAKSLLFWEAAWPVPQEPPQILLEETASKLHHQPQ
jgi:hypothetical protein